jgi:predicted dehydrogenase
LGLRDLAVCDSDQRRLDALNAEFSVTTFQAFDEAMDTVRPGAVLVCTPPHLHVGFAIKALEAGAHVFVEKPLSNTLEGVERMKQLSEHRGLVVQVGYNWRYHQGLRRVKEMLQEGAIGRVLWARAEAGQYLPDWRPSIDYRTNYTAHRSMGGGIILDGSHEIDYLCWLLGDVQRAYCESGSLSDLDVDVEDTASIVLRMRSGVVAEVHLDFVQRTKARDCKFVGTEGTILWDYVDGKLRRFNIAGKQWQSYPFDADIDGQYVAEIEDFLRVLGEGTRPLVGIDEATRTLKVALAALESSRVHQPVEV